jgi:hypothetical protein
MHALVLAHHGVEKYGELLLDETDIEEALEELEGLVQEEVRSMVTELLSIVYGLIRNMRIVMDGELNPLISYSNFFQAYYFSIRRSTIDRLYPKLSWYARCMYNAVDATNSRC